MNASGCIHSDLFHILRGYASLIPANKLRFPSHLQTQVIHDFLVDHILLNAHFKKYPPSQDYQRTFWKWIIPALEKKLGSDVGSSLSYLKTAGIHHSQSDMEIDSRIYEIYLELLNSSAPLGAVPGLIGQRPPSQSYITHFWRSGKNDVLPSSVNLDEYQTTTLLESRTMIESGTTGLRTWIASLILAQHLNANPALVHGKRILELGSGVGFLGSVVASLQLLADPSVPGMICMSDINESVLERCRDNTQLPCNLSTSHPDVRCCFLDWSAALDPDGIAPLTSLLNDELAPDLILGADIVFDPDLIPPLVEVLRLAVRPQNTALIALTVRNPATMRKFTDAVQTSGLCLEKLDFQVHDRGFIESLESAGDANNGVNIFRITG
ncbi:hypothetical protein DFH06DRAFT_309176 [Mycena polygramma]|nr:hypothetical protein DFH06DRAFT_309176 [Mycena polygramma]